MSNESKKVFKNDIRVIILYDSKFGNTKNVAISLSRGLEAGGIVVDCTSIHKFEIEKIPSYDVIAVGGPTHFRGLSKPMKAFLSNIKKVNIKDKWAFAFETKADFKLAGSSGKKILKTLTNKGVRILYSLISGIVSDQQGPLISNTLKKMEEKGLEIGENLYKIYKNKEMDKFE